MSVNIVEKIDSEVKVRHVLVSVSDKSGLETLIPALVGLPDPVKLYSTGGTFRAIREILGDVSADEHLTAISAYTGQPEMQGGLVKTLDFKIYLGLLSETYNPSHDADLRRVNGVAFDAVVCNLYPFKESISRDDATVEVARSNIDIGGPCMVRASAKNFLRVASITDPADYDRVVGELRDNGGCLSLATRFALSQKAFKHTAEYDTAIAAYLAEQPIDTVAACYGL